MTAIAIANSESAQKYWSGCHWLILLKIDNNYTILLPVFATQPEKKPSLNIHPQGLPALAAAIF